MTLHRCRNLSALAFIAVSSLALWGCGGGGSSINPPRVAEKAACSPGDNPETGLQGQTTLAERMGGSAAKGINCNLNLVGQFQGEGAYHAQTWIDHCAYYSTADGATMQHPGVAVIDVSDPTHPQATAYLSTPSMLETWESLKISTQAKLLAAVQAEGGAGINPGFDLYDVTHCTNPVLKASIVLPVAVKGHAGAISPDGRTYYGSYLNKSVYIIDISNPSQPQLMLNWTPPGGIGLPHDLSISEDGMRAYIMQIGAAFGAPNNDGLVIVDVSDFQLRRANPQPRVVSSLYWADGGAGMTTEQIAIGGVPYLLVSDELQAGTRAAACANKTPLFGYARLIDISNETAPIVVSKLTLQVDDPGNCAQLQNDPAFGGSFGYSAHYCTADNRQNAQLVACSRHEAGIRVFDVRNPAAPKEIAYYKPPIHTGANLPGSGINAVVNRTYDWNKSHSRFLNVNGQIELWTTSADNGFQVLQFNTATLDPALFSNVPTSLATITVP